MATRQLGFDIIERFDDIEAEIENRFIIFNQVISQNILYQNDRFTDLNKRCKGLEEANNYLNWYVKLPLYKKIWYSITNKNIQEIYNKIKQ